MRDKLTRLHSKVAVATHEGRSTTVLTRSLLTAITVTCLLQVQGAQRGLSPDVEVSTSPGPSTASQSMPAWRSAPLFGSDQIVRLDPVCRMIAPPRPPLAPGNPAPSTQRMSERLAALYRHQAATPESAAYLSDRLVTMFEQMAAGATAPNEQFQIKFNLAVQLINDSRPDAALNTFASMDRLAATNGAKLDPRTEAELQLFKGVASFRLGELENCLATHNADSCVFPLTSNAYHVLPRGSRGAVQMFSARLDKYPNDLGTRWLLNIAHMTLGEYPDKVDPRYLIPPERFASEYDMPRFLDVSEGLGLDANDLAGGSIIDDFDNDGLYDIVFSAWDQNGQLRYFRNQGNGTFIERTSEAGLVGEVGSLNIQQTDYNNDGWLDIWMLRGGWLGKGGRIPNSLLRNNGDGTFTDVTEEAGLLSFHPTMSSQWFDFDGDGWLDLFIGNETLDKNDPDWCELYRNNRNGTFTECARVSGINVAEFVKGVACADYDNDGRPDLYLSVRGSKNILLHNDGPADPVDPTSQQPPVWRFTDVTDRSGPVAEPIHSFGTFFFDYDNDGWQDLIIFGYYTPNGVGDIAADYMGLPGKETRTKIFHNDQNGRFSDVTAQAHLDRVCHTMGHNYGDLDNDGWLDLYCGTGDPDFRTLVPNRMFRNSNGKFFQDVTTATGTGHLQKGHGIAFADLNDDGNQDIYSSLGGAFTGDYARNALFLNPGSTNRWIKLRLVGTEANRAAIGARIKVTVQTPAGSRDLHRVVSGGGSFGSNPLRQEIGLGDATAVTAVQIQWPGSGTQQTLTGLQLQRGYEIREGGAAAVELKLNPVRLDKASLALSDKTRQANP